MRTLKLLVSSTAAMCLLHAATAHAQAEKDANADPAGGNTQQQITALMNQLQQARLKGDASFFQKYMTDDYVGIHGDGATETKQELVEYVKSGKLKYEAYDMHELKIRAYGDTAVANTLVAVKAMEANGKLSAGEFRTTWVWIRRKGNWQSAAFQATRVVP